MDYYKRPMNLISDLPRLNANRFSDKTAVVYPGDVRVTYREFNERTNRLANGLTDLGIRKGDRLGILAMNSKEALETFFATQKIGAVAVPLNFRITPREVKYCLDAAKCQALVYVENLAALVDPVKKELATIKTLIYSGPKVPSGEKEYETLVKNGRPQDPQVEIGFDDWSRMMFTGGTTGAPKIVIHTHGNVMAHANSMVAVYNLWSPDEVIMNHPPVFHIGGSAQVLASFVAGGTIILVDTMDPVAILKLIEKEKPTYLFLIPPQTYLNLTMVPNITDYNLNSINKLCTSAGLNEPHLFQKIFDTFPNLYKILSFYGATELGTGCGIEITQDVIKNHRERITCLGKELPLTEIRLVDDHGRGVPDGEPGEALLRAATCFIGYFENPEATAAAIDKDGWVHMGDIFIKDKEGYYHFVDRKKDMIKSGGENVFCQEVEAVIYSHPAVAECAVIGLPDPKWNEIVVAVLKTKPGATVTAEEIIRLCKDKLSSYKKPQKVFFMDDFPKSGVGKIQKFKLREKLV